MIKFKRILCPTDFSKPSHKALRIAGDLASHFSARLYILHVVATIPSFVTAAAPAPGMPFVGLNKASIASYIKELKKDAAESLDRLIKRILKKRVKATAVVKYGNPAEEIVKAADDMDIDLIVIATHGTAGFKHLLFGSVAERVIRMPSCPVLTIRVPKGES